MRALKNTVVLMIVLAAVGATRAEEEGKRAFARWEADGYCYPVKIEKQKEGKVLVRYTDDVTEWAPEWRVGYYTVEAGDEVFGNWKNRGLYYRGKVTKRDGDDIHIAYDDGDEEDTTIALIRMKLICHNAKEVGCAVFGRWGPDGYWYPGTVKEIKDGKYLIHFDDGDKDWLDEKHVFPYTPTYGDRVQGDWLGKGKFYKGKVIKRDGRNVRIEYDDGDVEDTTISYLRADYDDNALRRTK